MCLLLRLNKFTVNKEIACKIFTPSLDFICINLNTWWLFCSATKRHLQQVTIPSISRFDRVNDNCQWVCVVCWCISKSLCLPLHHYLAGFGKCLSFLPNATPSPKQLAADIHQHIVAAWQSSVPLFIFQEIHQCAGIHGYQQVLHSICTLENHGK